MPGPVTVYSKPRCRFGWTDSSVWGQECAPSFSDTPQKDPGHWIALNAAGADLPRSKSVSSLMGWQRSGISIQGGTLAAILFILSTQAWAPHLEIRNILASATLSLPLGEGIGRIGCYWAGCCGSRREKGRERYGAVQLLSSAMNIAAYTFLIFSAVKCNLPLPEAGILAFSSNAVIRLILDPLRESTTISRKRALGYHNLRFSPSSCLDRAACRYKAPCHPWDWHRYRERNSGHWRPGPHGAHGSLHMARVGAQRCFLESNWLHYAPAYVRHAIWSYRCYICRERDPS